MKSLLALALWPFLLLFTSVLVSRDGSVPAVGKDEAPAIEPKLLRHSHGFDTVCLSGEEKEQVLLAGNERQNSIVKFADWTDFSDVLAVFWEYQVSPSIYHQYKGSLRRLDHAVSYDPEPLFSLSRPDWYIGFTHEFTRSIRNIDGRKRGRVLQAIAKIAVAPMSVQGNTIKPLSGKLTGLWRCRVGDDRLVYLPDRETSEVFLICFGPRSDVYDGVPDHEDIRK